MDTERRNGMKDFEEKLDNIRESHTRCQVETHIQLKTLIGDNKEIKKDIKNITQQISAVTLAMSTKINGVDKNLSLDIARNIKGHVNRRSLVVGGGTAVVGTALLNILWEWLKTKLGGQ